MKSLKKGFVQIPILVSIIVGLFALSIIGYFNYKTMSESAQSKIDLAVANQKKEDELNLLKNQIDTLKAEKPAQQKTTAVNQPVIQGAQIKISTKTTSDDSPTLKIPTQNTVTPIDDVLAKKKIQYENLKTYMGLVYKSQQEQLSAARYSEQGASASNAHSDSLAVTYYQSAIDAYTSAYQILLSAEVPTDLPFSPQIAQSKNINLRLIDNNKQIAQAFYQASSYSANGQHTLAIDALSQIKTLLAQGRTIIMEMPAYGKAEADYFQGFDLSFGLPF